MSSTSSTPPGAIARAWRTALLVSVLALLVVACGAVRQDGAAGASRALELAPPPRVGAPVDLTPQARGSVRFAEDGRRFVATTTHVAARTTGSAIELRPLDAAGATAGDELTLETTLVTRGDHVLATPSDDATPRLDQGGAVAIDRGALVERIEATSDGIEQSWSFAREPAGEGDLVVHVRAGGATFTARTDHGLHFGATSGRLGLRYGAATWIDRDGARTSVGARYADGEIVLVVPADVLRASRYPAVLDPVISTEREIDMPVGGSSASGEQYSAAVAPSGNNGGYLAVWYDRRSVRPALYGARISSTGTVLDDTGVPLVTGVGAATPSIASSGNGFLVTWFISYVDEYQAPGVYALRLDAQGRPLDSAPIPLVVNVTNISQTRAAFDGENWLVVWQQYQGAASQFDILGARLPRTGEPLDRTPIRVSADADSESAPELLFDGENYLLAFRVGSDILARKIDKNGVQIGPRITLVATGSSYLSTFALATNGTEHLVAWGQYVTSTYDVYVRRFNRDGASLDGGPIGVAVGATNDDRPRVAWDGTTFTITWMRGTQLLAARMNAAGVFTEGAAAVLVSNYLYEGGLASDGSSSLLVTREYSAGLSGSDVIGAVLARPLAAASTFVVSKAANSQTQPVTAWVGGGAMTVWLDTRDGRSAIYGVKLGATGAATTAPFPVVADAKWSADMTRPRIASDGTSALVVFFATDTSLARAGVWAVRLDQNGAPDPAGPFELSQPGSLREPDVAFDGQAYLVAWEYYDTQWTIVGTRVGKDGNARLDAEMLRLSPTSAGEIRQQPTVASDGAGFYVAWTTSRPTPTGIQVPHVYGTRVSREGAPLDGERPICTAFLLQRTPRAVGDRVRGGYLVVWEDYRTALDTADVYAARVDREGNVLDGTSGFAIATGAHDESRPRASASSDGNTWLVGWRDLRGGTGYDLYGAWLSRAGTNYDPGGVTLSAEDGDEDEPDFTASGEGKHVLVYQRLDARTGYGSNRLRARAIDSGAPVGATCDAGEDCASRSCSTGLCCATECAGCGECNVTAGTCTPRPAGSESPTCPGYRCTGTLECPSSCESDADCASNATCDPSGKTCVSRVVCADDRTLKDISGRLTDCAPFKCIGDACRAQCGSVDDCAPGFVCDFEGRCSNPPGDSDGGCSASSASTGSSAGAGAFVIASAALLLGLRRRRHAERAREG